MKKRIISLLLAVVMIVGMIPLEAITAFASDEYPIVLDEDKRYEISDATYTLPWDANRVFEISGSAYVVFTNVTFFNVKGGDGCCVYIDLTDDFSGVKFYNCKFINCESTGNGVVYINNITTPYNSVVFEDCTIENCHADNGYGGFLYVNDGDAQPVFNRTTITNCKAKRGGVEYIQSSNYPSQFNDCTVTGCTASGDGGFVYMNDAEAVIRCSNTLISDCSADDGGAFYMDNGSSLVFENGCVLQNCRADSEGGAIYINDADGIIYGNGIHYEGEAAPDKSMAAVISGCSAEYGGGVYIAKGSNVNNLVFADNASAYKGGGLFNNSEGDAQCRIANCRFIHNKSGDNENNRRSGGGLYVDDSNGEVFACEFYENEAYESGADLYANSTVSECIFTGIFGDDEGTKVVDKSKESNSKIRFAEVYYTFDGKGSGTESDPYRIEDIRDWDTLYFWTESGKATDDTYYRLDADLTVEFSVGKTGDGCFRGHFDGNHHSLKVVRGGDDVNVGAFGFVRNAEIGDLTVTGSIRGRSAVGGFVGNASGCTFTNCVNYADITCSSSNAGGIAGQAAGGATFTNCENFADVTGSDSVGGIVGNLFLSDLAESDQSVTLYVCRSFGGVRAVSNVGGLVGRIADESESYQCVFTFTNCIHGGSVTGNRYAGGILGREETAVSLRNVHSFGSVSASLYAHGISGVSADGSAYELCLYNKEYCTADAHGIGVSPDALYGKTTDTVGGKEFRMPDYVNDYINENGKAAEGWLYMVFTESGMPEFVSGDAAIALGADGLLHDYSSYGDVIFLDENTAVLGKLASFGWEPTNKKVYIVNKNIHHIGRIKIYEDVVLIICDGCEYIVDGGIDLENTAVPDISTGDLRYVDREAKLTVTTKSLGNNMGKLTVKAANPGDAAIGGNAGRVDINWEQPSIPNTNGAALNIYGGHITANGNCENSVGIGGGAGVKSDFYSSMLEINCNADGGSGCTINMYNGMLDVTSGKNAVGIGGGHGYLIKRFSSDTWDGSGPTQVWNGNGGNGGTLNYHGGTVKVHSELNTFGRGLKGDESVTTGSTSINFASGSNVSVLFSDDPEHNFTQIQTNELAKLSEKPYSVITNETELITELKKHGHKYEFEYTWASDYSTCTAYGTCPNCPEGTEGHFVSETVDTEIQYYQKCMEFDRTVYTAVFQCVCASTQQTTVKGENFGEHQWEDAGKNEEHRCIKCGETRKHTYRAVYDEITSMVVSRCTGCGKELVNTASGGIAYITAEKGAYINSEVDIHSKRGRIAMTVDVHSANEYWFGFFQASSPTNICCELFNNGTELVGTWYYQATAELVEPGLHTVELDKAKIKVDGTVVAEAEHKSTTGTFRKMYLFAQDNYHYDYHAGEIFETYIPDWQSTIYCYNCSIYDETALKRYFIPYVNEQGEAGLYDLVEEKFYGSAGTSGKITAYCTVSFDMNGHGTQVEPIDVEYGKTLTRPADPMAKGYTFDGWYKDKECTEPWDFENEPVTASTGLYAKWTKIVLHPDASGKYHIRNAEDWETFDSMVKDGYTFAGETVLLDGDITVTNLVGGFNSNASLSRPFCGTFDGQNHTVTIAFGWDNGSDKGAFSHTNNGAVIKNLTVKGNIKGDYSIGGIVGNSANTTFINCTSYVNVRGAQSGNTSHQYTGGIVGYACDGTRFENCTVFGDVRGNKCVGGIAGLADSGTVFENCIVYGNVTGEESVGGIVGRVSTNKRGNYVSTLLNCIASGPVTGSTYSGGIIGLESGPVSVKNAHFFGTVSSSTDAMGITGSANEGSYYENCFYNKYCPADAHGIGLDIADIPDAANNYIIEQNKTAEAWRYLAFDENENPVFIDCIHNRGCTVSYDWDGNCCTAMLVCDNCHIVLESETASDLTPIVYDAPDCRTTGYYYYVADFENELFETQESEKTDTKLGPHCYENYICQYCPAEDLEGAKNDAIKAIRNAVDNSTDVIVLLLADTAENAIHGTESVADVLQAWDYWITAINKQLGTTHTHTFADTYTHDENHHWKECTCGHDVVSGFGAHSFDEGVADGNKTTYTCKCGYTKVIYGKTDDTEGEIIGGATYTGISLTLGSDIAINFYMQLSDEARQKGTMTFNIGGRIVTMNGTDAKYNESEKKYYFSTPLTALEMAETVIATFKLNGTDYVKEYSVEEYIEEIVGHSDKYGKNAVALAKKIANYGHYAQIYLESIHSNVKIGDDGYAAMYKCDDVDISVNAAKESLANYTVKLTGTSANLSLYGSTVYFDAATALNYYVTVKNGVKPSVAALNTATGKSKEVEIKLYKDNIYIVSVKDITATELADDIAVTVNGEITLTGSVFAYCNAVMTKNGQTDAAKNAMAAFYEYYKAAVDYAEDTVTFDNDTYCGRIYQTVKHGEKVQRPDPDPMTYGFVFDGWYKDEERTIPWNFDTPITEDTTIYGKWISQEDYQKIVENAKFQVSDLRNNAVSEIESLNLEDGKKQDFIAEVDKARFEAFSLIENAKYTNDIQIIIAEATNKINEVLSDAEHAVEYTVSFDMMGHGEQVSSQKVKKEGYAELTVPEAEGYFFNGWFKDETFQDQWRFNTDTVNGDITLYADWRKIITVTFDMMGHGTQLGQLNAYEGSTFGAPYEPMDSSFKFEGWYKDSNFTEKWNFETDIVGDTDITLYAKWVAKQ